MWWDVSLKSGVKTRRRGCENSRYQKSRLQKSKSGKFPKSELRLRNPNSETNFHISVFEETKNAAHAPERQGHGVARRTASQVLNNERSLFNICSTSKFYCIIIISCQLARSQHNPLTPEYRLTEKIHFSPRRRAATPVGKEI